ncbi:MAG: hypothetical protein DBP01_02365, partial [gamma proteobacterium symbiont of Ctena orbiculata]
TDAQCAKALYQLRWPTGYVCPECGNITGCKLKNRKIYQCHKCHHQTSLRGLKSNETKTYAKLVLLVEVVFDSPHVFSMAH